MTRAAAAGHAGKTTADGTASPSGAAGGDPARQTPAMRQYARFKRSHPECVLFFRMGDFYEMFDEDAVLCHKELGITLTERTKGIPMAGVPYHAVEGYLRKMIERGHRVAVCEQVEDPKEAKGVVKRAVTRVLTPGTLVDESLLEEGTPNRIAAIRFTEAGDEAGAVVAAAELSTGAFRLHTFSGDSVVDEIARLAPSELIHVETADGDVPPRVKRLREACGCALTARPAWTFRPAESLEALREHFGVKTLAGFGVEDDDPALPAAGALLRYLRDTQGPAADAADDGSPAARPLAHLRPPCRERSDARVVLDRTTLRALEIERTMRTGGTEGSLLSCLARPRTAMGKRALRDWLCYPLRDLDAIRERQDAVEAFLRNSGPARELASTVDRVQDVARIAGRLGTGRVSPRDLVGLGRSLGVLPDLGRILRDLTSFSRHVACLDELAEALGPLARSIEERCVDSPPAHLREGGLFRDGVDGPLDEARSLQDDAGRWLARYQKRLIDETRIPSLKVGFNKVFGYYIEITHVHREKVPDAFHRKQTLKNAERYVTPELKEFEEKITTANTRAIEREQVLFDRLCREAAGNVEPIGRYADLVAEIDVLLAFAEHAARTGAVRPRIVEEPILRVVEGRPPVLDRTLEEGFVPNDCVLGGRSEGAAARGHEGTRAEAPPSGGPPRVDPGSETTSRDPADVLCSGGEAGAADGADAGSPATLALITGPNMAGKSTYIRQVALITLLAHTGCFVPAREATIGLVDRIFTRIGANDELHAGRSTFMVEMTETANILHHATERSLVILDEIGRGTSTLDGLSLAWAIAESLAEVRCRTLFATHYHELTTLAERLPNVTNLHVAVREWAPDDRPGHEEIVFLYRILPGRTDRSYGIHVAKIAGVPTETIRRARQLLEAFSVQTEGASPDGAAAPSSRDGPAGAQLGLFTEYLDHPVLEDLRSLDLDSISPIRAFETLRDLRARLDAESKTKP